MHARSGTAPVVERLSVRTVTVPTDAHEADGTAEWDSTTVLIVEAHCGEHTGLGFSYTAAAAAAVVEELLSSCVVGHDALSPPAAWARMRRTIRNAGYPGIAASAISAVDVALWDLKARLLELSLSVLLGRVRDHATVYGSGGFTSYSDEQLERQLRGWVDQGIRAVKMKVGTEPERDPARVLNARAAIGDGVRLMVDANGAYQRKQALALAEVFAQESDICWFEEPVTSDDLEGLRLLRDRAPARISIAAGEYGYSLFDFRRLLEAGAVDVLQADVTRCGGITEMVQVAALCQAHAVRLSAHTSPSLHAHLGVALEPMESIEYFHDHVRIEELLFDGLPQLRDGALWPDPALPGHGISLRADAPRD
ncbi:MAG TPA: enolase C-terminal domain-like protein [Solirubrobacteraceae bacterium]|nr:enolase C-terminal domain-like protein [Solirubrobacteraceae bacterium]